MKKNIFLLILLLRSLIAFGANTYQLPGSENITINEFGICKKVINNGSNNYIVPTGIAADWSAFILHVPSDLTLASCSNDCVGSWGACVSGVQTYTITSPATGGGAACPATNGATQVCGVNCVGSWGACSGGGQQYTITTPASGGGTACPSVNGAIAACGTNCVGSWSTCSNGSQTYSVTTPASGGGIACPNNNGDTRTCGTNCVGSWGACSGGIETYTITTPASGGGVDCPVANSTTRACGGTDCEGSWGACSAPCLGGTQTYTITKPATGTGAACPNANGDTQACNVGACGSFVFNECFVEGTLVKLANGEDKKIEEIEIGDIVRSYDEKLGKMIDTPVIESLKHQEKLNELFTFELSNGKQVTSNGIHPYFVENYKKYISAEKIYGMWKNKLEIKFLTETKKLVSLKEVSVSKNLSKLYNLHVLSPYDLNYYNQSRYGHNYFANGVLVHNSKCVGYETVMAFSGCNQCCLDAGGQTTTIPDSSDFMTQECKMLATNQVTTIECCRNAKDAAMGYSTGGYECYPGHSIFP